MRGVVGGLLGIALLVGMVGGTGAYFAWQHYSADLPDVDGLRNYQPPVMSRVYAGDARLIAELASERRIFVPYSAIPDLVKQAFVSAEDQNFWVHKGVDPLAIVRAGVFDLAHMGEGRRPIGASTITQQVAKNMLLDNQVSLSRKVREAILAMMRPETPFIMPETRTYLRDCFDHAISVLELLETYREMSNGLMEVYLMQASNRMSEVMKTMAVITVFFMPLSFLAGIYGMNFERDVGNMPELGWKYGYEFFWFLVVMTVVGLFWWLRRKRWL